MIAIFLASKFELMIVITMRGVTVMDSLFHIHLDCITPLLRIDKTV